MIARSRTVRALVRALEDRIAAIEADQRAVRDELMWIRATALPRIASEHDEAIERIASEHDEAIEALQRVLNARTERSV